MAINDFFNEDSPVARIDQKSYNKAIDEFSERIKQHGIDNMYECFDQYGIGCHGNCDECRNDFIMDIDEIAKQLKAGVKDE